MPLLLLVEVTRLPLSVYTGIPTALLQMILAMQMNSHIRIQAY